MHSNGMERFAKNTDLFKPGGNNKYYRYKEESSVVFRTYCLMTDKSVHVSE